MINKYSSIPLYSQLKLLILEKIENGDFPEDSKIPSEQELCGVYDISRPTVRQAISELTNNGTLYKLKGKGTFVAKSKRKINVKNYSGFTDSILDSDVPGERDIKNIEIITSKDYKMLNSIFNLTLSPSVENEFARITFTSIIEKDNISLNISHIPLTLFPNIAEDVKDKMPSHHILKGKYPLLPARTKSTLEVIYTDQADAQILLVQTGMPVIKVDSIIQSKNGQVIEYITSKYRADKCRLSFENNR